VAGREGAAAGLLDAATGAAADGGCGQRRRSSDPRLVQLDRNPSLPSTDRDIGLIWGHLGTGPTKISELRFSSTPDGTNGPASGSSGSRHTPGFGLPAGLPNLGQEPLRGPRSASAASRSRGLSTSHSGRRAAAVASRRRPRRAAPGRSPLSLCRSDRRVRNSACVVNTSWSECPYQDVAAVCEECAVALTPQAVKC
jgi:hypothetical protein